MRKIVFALVAFSSLMVLSCRQQEEIMDSEDLKSLSVLRQATSKVQNLNQNQNLKVDTTSISVKSFSTNSSDMMEFDGEIKSPPR